MTISREPWGTPFPILNQFIVPCPILTVASWPAYRFLRSQVRWSGIPVSLTVFHSLLWPTQSKALKWRSEVAQSCPTLCDPMDYSLPGSSIHGIFQARILEWGAISFSRGPSQLRDQTQVSCIVGRCFTVWATGESIYSYWKNDNFDYTDLCWVWWHHLSQNIAFECIISFACKGSCSIFKKSFQIP